MNDVKRYLVTVKTPKGTAELEVPSAGGAQAASRLAFWGAVGQRWGDVDEITVTDVRELAREEWS